MIEERHTDIPCIGWRYWSFNYEWKFLVSPVQWGFVWRGPVMRMSSGGEPTFDFNINSTSPTEAGLFSFKTRDQLLGSFSGMSFFPVYGTVRNYGKVVEHERGWRAQICVVNELFVPEKYPSWARQALQDRYQCPVYGVAPKPIVIQGGPF